MKLPLTGDPQADQLLADDPLALLIGMLLDQQVPMEKAFRGPYDLKERMGGRLDAAEIASADAGPAPVPRFDGGTDAGSVPGAGGEVRRRRRLGVDVGGHRPGAVRQPQ